MLSVQRCTKQAEPPTPIAVSRLEEAAVTAVSWVPGCRCPWIHPASEGRGLALLLLTAGSDPPRRRPELAWGGLLWDSETCPPARLFPHIRSVLSPRVSILHRPGSRVVPW